MGEFEIMKIVKEIQIELTKVQRLAVMILKSKKVHHLLQSMWEYL